MRLQSNFKSMSFFFLIPLILSIGLASSISFFDLIQEAEGAKGIGASAMIDITGHRVEAGQSMPIDVVFADRQGNNYQDVNYNILAKQDGKTILNEKGVYAQDGKNTHQTMPLPKAESHDFPVRIVVEFLGFGTNEPFTGPIGDMETIFVVPEFGTVAVMILGISIISIIAVTSRSKVIPRL